MKITVRKALSACCVVGSFVEFGRSLFATGTESLAHVACAIGMGALWMGYDVACDLVTVSKVVEVLARETAALGYVARSTADVVFAPKGTK